MERGAGWDLWEARPRTGRTHQIRLHAARLGAPILGDGEYSGAPAARLFLHAHSLELPGRPRLEAPLPQAFREVLAGRSPTDPGLAALAAREARELLFDSAETNAYLWIDREHDGFPGLRVERLGDVGLLLRYDESPSELPRRWLDALRRVGGLRALVEQRRPRRGPRSGFRLLRGELPAPRFWVREHGLEYLVDLSPEGCSTGFFLDQRETRRRLLGEDLSGRNVLNVFAHTGSLSVAAACAGARTVTLDLSRSYLDWARENMRRNAIDPGEHDFVHGDALDWLRRFHKKGRRFDLVLCDPPSFATGRGRRGKKTWSIERDLPLLVERAARLLAPEGRLLVSTNLRRLRWERFEERIRAGLAAADRTGALESDSLPLDFRSGPADAPYLKLAWIRIDGRGPALALGRSAHRV
ncbi:MAG: methyltransferase domain-containing protein [Planctomycetota bacterium]|nr:MAG: methyltransferase domain-containing protein [Planctomycetota bacterium]